MTHQLQLAEGVTIILILILGTIVNMAP